MTYKIIVFVKNLKVGKVKTRLAASVGNQMALRIYKALIQITFTAISLSKATKVIYMAEDLETNTPFIPDSWSMKIQNGENLGDRMAHAFSQELQQNNKAVLIGTDCPEINDTLITKAFQALDTYDVILGPAEDGGYYLIGLKSPKHALFEKIKWSTSSVLSETIGRCIAANLTYFLLPTLSDLDVAEDLEKFPELLIACLKINQ